MIKYQERVIEIWLFSDIDRYTLDDATEMRVYEYLTENLPKIIKAYRES